MASCFRFGGSLQPFEVRRPKSVEEIAHSGEAVGAHDEQVASALAPLGDEAGRPKNPQVVGNDLLRDSELERYLADGQGALADPGEDAAAGAVGQRLQCSVSSCCTQGHDNNSSSHLYKCQLVE